LWKPAAYFADRFLSAVQTAQRILNPERPLKAIGAVAGAIVSVIILLLQLIGWIFGPPPMRQDDKVASWLALKVAISMSLRTGAIVTGPLSQVKAA
jgi:hypothetical protein